MATSTNGEDRSKAEPHIIVRNLTMAYGSFVLMRDLNFVVKRGDIFIIMGGSGCGKSTLLRHLIGLKEPATGEIIYGDVNFTRAEPAQRELLLRRFGILYQSGALWSSMTLAENIGLPLGEFTDLTPAQIREIAALKLALVGLKVFPVVILGGLDSIGGAVLGGLIIGVVENLAAGYIDPIVGGGTKDFAPYVLMVIALMIRPYGMFGTRRIERV